MMGSSQVEQSQDDHCDTVILMDVSTSPDLENRLLQSCTTTATDLTTTTATTTSKQPINSNSNCCKRKRHVSIFARQQFEEIMPDVVSRLANDEDDDNDNNSNAGQFHSQLSNLQKNGVPCRVLFALAHLATKRLKDTAGLSEQSDEYEDYITLFATFLLSYLTPKRNKLECLRTLVSLRGAIHGCCCHDETSCEIITDKTLKFLISPPGTTEQEYLPTQNDQDVDILLWEVRAVCRRQWEKLAQRRRECLTRIARGGEAVADCITNSASWMERALLSQSVPVIHNGIDNVGNFLKSILTPAEHDALMVLGRDSNADDPNLPRGKPAVVLLIYTDAAKRATGSAKESVRTVLHGIRDTSTDGIHWVAHRMDEEKLGERLITDPSSRDVLASWGKVGLASLGATAILSEAMLEATKSIGQKLANVTAHVVEHKFGTLAGQVVQDSCDATGNIFRTVTYVMMFKTKVITKVIVRNTAKVQCRKNLNEKQQGQNIPTTIDTTTYIQTTTDHQA